MRDSEKTTFDLSGLTTLRKENSATPNTVYLICVIWFINIAY